MSAPQAWRSRIVGHGELAPAEITPHDLNWRRHPAQQRAALAGVLDEVGWVQDVIVNRTTGRLVDGHLRVAVALERGEASVPVVYVELSDDEERLVLATLDPIGSLAETDAAALSALLADMAPTADGLADLLGSLQTSITPTLPTPSEQREPTLLSECLIEIRCTKTDRDDFADMLIEWGMRDTVTVDIS